MKQNIAKPLPPSNHKVHMAVALYTGNYLDSVHVKYFKTALKWSLQASLS